MFVTYPGFSTISSEERIRRRTKFRKEDNVCSTIHYYLKFENNPYLFKKVTTRVYFNHHFDDCLFIGTKTFADSRKRSNVFGALGHVE